MKIYEVQYWSDGPGATTGGYITYRVAAPKKQAAIDFVNKEQGVRKTDQALTKATFIKYMGKKAQYVK